MWITKPNRNSIAKAEYEKHIFHLRPNHRTTKDNWRMFLYINLETDMFCRLQHEHLFFNLSSWFFQHEKIKFISHVDDLRISFIVRDTNEKDIPYHCKLDELNYYWMYKVSKFDVNIFGKSASWETYNNVDRKPWLNVFKIWKIEKLKNWIFFSSYERKKRI